MLRRKRFVVHVSKMTFVGPTRLVDNSPIAATVRKAIVTIVNVPRSLPTTAAASRRNHPNR